MKKQSDAIFIARQLRKNMTSAEKKLWKKLHLCQLGEFQFRRQALIGIYVADFVCHINTPHPGLPPQGGKGRTKL